MPNYLLTYTGGSDMPSDPADQAAVMQAWGTWYETLGDAVVDGGAPLGESRSITPDGAVSGEPVSKLTGYTILAADDLDHATTLAKGCPILTGDGTVEVSTAIDMG
ncbi:YciI family protein [Euzebya tangerina]|uniref:YciI family protein n=1 Tax=Euzebya tangerina TaxID=591198 RepID=UPI000E313A72|nr:hypothetical protein [Euzebya tangerina]